MPNDSPTPSKGAQQAITLHTFGVPAHLALEAGLLDFAPKLCYLESRAKHAWPLRPLARTVDANTSAHNVHSKIGDVSAVQ